MTTSSVTNEGKSLISLNLAAVLAAPGNKVALLEFDMRLPAIFNMIDKSNETGLSEYLSGEITSSNDIAHEVESLKSLHIYPAGKMPANVADLLLSKKLPALIATLKQQYKIYNNRYRAGRSCYRCIILGKYADVVIYIVRQNNTLKMQLENINDIYKAGKFSNLCIVFNDIKSGAKYGSGYESHKAYEHSYGKNKRNGFSINKRHGFKKKLAL
jgi:Mrp family chromosome partitioning ATPase